MSDRPRYVAIIMDGNARWAASRGLGVTEGHQAGTDALKRTVRLAGDFGIEQLTVYAFSTENWTRPEPEVSGIMSLFVERIRREAPELDEEGVRLRFIGRRDRLVAAACAEEIDWAEQLTARHTARTLFVGVRLRRPGRDPARGRALRGRRARRSSAATSTRPT